MGWRENLRAAARIAFEAAAIVEAERRRIAALRAAQTPSPQGPAGEEHVALAQRLHAARMHALRMQFVQQQFAQSMDRAAEFRRHADVQRARMLEQRRVDDRLFQESISMIVPGGPCAGCTSRCGRC